MNIKFKKYSKGNKHHFGIKWVRSESGNTYLCPLREVRRLKRLTDDELRRLAINESLNPQNE